MQHLKTAPTFAKHIAILFGTLFSFTLFFLLTNPASAFVCTYQQTTGGAVGDFNNAANWTNCNTASPTAGDTVLIPASTSTALSANASFSQLNATGTVDAVSFTLTATSSVQIAGTGVVTSTTGVINFNSVDGTTSSTGAIGTNTGNLLIGGVFTNDFGTLNVGAGNATTTGAVTNTGTINNNSGVLSVSSDFTNTGTFDIGTGTFRLSGSGTQSITVAAVNNLDSIKTGGVASFITNTTDVLGTLTTFNAGTLSFGTNVDVAGATTIGGTATVTSTSAVLTFTGTVTSTGSIGSSSGNILFSSTLQNNGTLDIGSGIATSTGHVTSTGTINNRSGRYEIVADFVDTGTYTGNTGTLKFVNDATQRFSGPSGIFNLTIHKTGGSVDLVGNVTSTGTFTHTSGTLAVGNNRFAATGTYVNNATITIGASGSIIHATDDLNLTNSAYTNVSTYEMPGSIFVTLTDPNRNLLAATIETVEVTVSGDAAAGADSETLTLTETTASSGIFRNTTALPLNDSAAVLLANSQLEMTQNGTVTVSYTDTLDADDTPTDAVTATIAVVASSGSSGPGGSGNIPLPSTAEDAETTARLNYFDSIGYTTHDLVKLPNDGDPNTQFDSAVYYLGADGRRHAFPNDKAYFTWYADFSDVKTIQATELANIPLGENITYKPGVKMVKFTTDNRVYAVAKGGVLRWITTETIAILLYGSTWNTMIDDINDAFYPNYSFEQDIDEMSDFNPAEMESQVATPSDSM